MLQLFVLLFYLWRLSGMEFFQHLQAVRWTLLVGSFSAGLTGTVVRSLRRQIILRPVQHYSLLDLTAQGLCGIRQKLHLIPERPYQRLSQSLIEQSGVPYHVSRVFLAFDRGMDAAAIVLLFWFGMLAAGRGVILSLAVGCGFSIALIMAIPGEGLEQQGNAFTEAVRERFGCGLPLRGKLLLRRIRMVTAPVGRGGNDIAVCALLTMAAAGLDLLTLKLTADAVHLSIQSVDMIPVYLFLYLMWSFPGAPGVPGLSEIVLIRLMSRSGWTFEAAAVSLFIVHCAWQICLEWASSALTAAGGMNHYNKPVLLRIKMNAILFPCCAVPKTPAHMEPCLKNKAGLEYRWIDRLARSRRQMQGRHEQTPVSG